MKVFSSMVALLMEWLAEGYSFFLSLFGRQSSNVHSFVVSPENPSLVRKESSTVAWSLRWGSPAVPMLSFVFNFASKSLETTIMEIPPIESSPQCRRPFCQATVDPCVYKRSYPMCFRIITNFRYDGDGSDQRDLFCYDGSRFRWIDTLRIAQISRPCLIDSEGSWNFLPLKRFPLLHFLNFGMDVMRESIVEVLAELYR